MATSLKGVICGNPGLQAGGKCPGNPVWRTVLSGGRLPLRVPQFELSPPYGAVFQTDGLRTDLPALKGGVTATFALQAIYAFQANAVANLIYGRLVKTSKGCCLPFEVLQQPTVLYAVLTTAQIAISLTGDGCSKLGSPWRCATCGFHRKSPHAASVPFRRRERRNTAWRPARLRF